MENEMFMSSGIQPWQAMELNCVSNPPSDCFFSPSWDGSMDQAQSVQFDSALSSMVSSPVASNPNNNTSENALMIRELIGKLGRIGNSNANLPEISPLGSHSCYSTPLSSPPKVGLVPPMMGLNPSVADLSADPGFAERAARFSCFGSRSFNGRTSQIGMIGNPDASAYRANNSPARIPRVLSSPSLKALGAGPVVDRPDMGSSQEESSVSEQRENGNLKATNDVVNSRKRKAAQKGKAKESSANATAKVNEDSNAKRPKQNEGDGGEIETEKAAGEDDKKAKNDAKKPPEPLKDYIHVRARRGQATDSHSLAERVRRERIGERMKLLQDLVPGCNKVIGKALMLDEIINYVQSLQLQVEFLSMKLATVNTSMDSTMDSVMPNKDMFQSNNSMPNHSMFPSIDSSGFHGQNISDGTVMDPLGMAAINDLQYHNFYGGDLHTIVQMGFGPNIAHQDSSYSIQHLQGSGQASQMKVEL